MLSHVSTQQGTEESYNCARIDRGAFFAIAENPMSSNSLSDLADRADSREEIPDVRFAITHSLVSPPLPALILLGLRTVHCFRQKKEEQSGSEP